MSTADAAYISSPPLLGLQGSLYPTWPFVGPDPERLGIRLKGNKQKEDEWGAFFRFF